MGKTEFLRELRQKLARLPEAEVENAMNYYEEYFNDAGVQYEMRVLEELGSPSAVADKLIGEYAISDAEARKTKGSSPFLIVTLAICASPIALPLVIVLFSLAFAFFLVLLALGLSGIAVIISGVVATLAGFFVMFSSYSTGLFYIGAGLLAASIGGAIGGSVFWLSKNALIGLQKMLGKLLIRRSGK